MRANVKEELSKDQTCRGRIFYFFLRILVMPLVRLIWIRRVEGRENLPASGPFLLAANHQSYFDFISLVSALPDRRLYFLAAEKFFSSSFWRLLVEWTGQIKVDREAEDKSAVLDQALAYLRAGRIVAIFPQGTRSRSGEIEKVYSGVAKLALAARVPVVPVGIKGAFEVLPPQEKKPKWQKIIDIHIGRSMDFRKYYDQSNPEIYQKITDEVMIAIASLADKKYK